VSPTSRGSIEKAKSNHSASKSYSEQTHLKNQTRDIGNEVHENLSKEDLSELGELSEKKIEGAFNPNENELKITKTKS
jgi:hypothetical protein